MVSILEFSKPRKFPIKQIYHFYFRFVTPMIGKIFSKDSSAYTYLPESVKAFPDGEDFLNVLRKAGFKESKAIPVSFGIASIYVARK
jgi:demethylmenaquinone methyltransferase/2-methoxy-6-polyprenyl-1,4-benzoquinol methylase